MDAASEQEQAYAQLGVLLLAGLLHPTVGARSHPDHDRTGWYTISVVADATIQLFTFHATYLPDGHDGDEENILTLTRISSRRRGKKQRITSHRDRFALDVDPQLLTGFVGVAATIPHTTITAASFHRTPTGVCGYVYGYLVLPTSNEHTLKNTPILPLGAGNIAELRDGRGAFGDHQLPHTAPGGEPLEVLVLTDAPNLIELEASGVSLVGRDAA